MVLFRPFSTGHEKSCICIYNVPKIKIISIPTDRSNSQWIKSSNITNGLSSGCLGGDKFSTGEISSES